MTTLPERITKFGALSNLKRIGFNPQVVFDVGVHQGTPELYSNFPESLHVLIEPVAEQEPHLKAICESLPHATYMIAAAAESTGEVNMKISRNFAYSGIYDRPEAEDSETHFNRTVPTVSIDELARQSDLPGDALLKIDVDGKEIDVLKGAVQYLQKTECVVIEATLFDQIHEVISFMTDSQFVLYDICDHLYRPLDGALWQVDLIFLPQNSAFRKKTAFAEVDDRKKMYVGN